MTSSCSLFKMCPFQRRKVFKIMKRLILNTKRLLPSNRPFGNLGIGISASASARRHRHRDCKKFTLSCKVFIFAFRSFI